MGLAGRIAEEIVFEDVTTGAANDIQQVTQIARRMVKMFGMSDSVGMVNYGDDTDQPFLGYAIASGRDYSDDTAAMLDAEIKRIIDVAYSETTQLLQDNRESLDELADALLSKETVEREEILRILGLEDDTDEVLPEAVAKHMRETDPAQQNGSAPTGELTPQSPSASGDED